MPFLACLPIAFAATALLGAVLERTLYRPMYARPHLDQVLFSIGLVFMAVTAVDYVVGSMQQNIQLPEWLQGRLPIEAVGIGKYRLFIIVSCALLTVGAAVDLVAHAFRQPPARCRSTIRVSPAASASTSTASSSPPSPSAPGSPASAARSAPRCSASTRRSRSSS